MKHKAKELDVDFIGGQSPLTKKEEFAISEFIKANKAKPGLRGSRKLKSKRIRKDRHPA